MVCALRRLGVLHQREIYLSPVATSACPGDPCSGACSGQVVKEPGSDAQLLRVGSASPHGTWASASIFLLWV